MSLHRPILVVFASDLAGRFALGIIGLLLIRFLQPSELALLALATSIATAVSQALGGSVNRIFIIEAPNAGFTGYLRPFIGLQLAILVLISLAGLPLSRALPGIYVLTVLLAAGMLLADFSKTIYQKQLRFGAFSAIELARSGLMAIGIGLLLLELRYGVKAWHAIAVQAAALLLVSAAAVWRYAVRASSSSIPTGMIRPQHGYLLGYFIMLALFSQVDIFMLKGLADADTLASYASAARYYQLLSLALGALHTVVLPAMQSIDSGQALDELFRKHLRLLAGFAPAVAVCAALAGWILPWVDLGRYPDAVPTFQILCASVIVSFAFSPHVNLVFTRRRFRFLFALIIAALAVNVALNAALIPLWGGRGAAIGTLIASACVTVPIFILSRRLRAPAGTMGRT